MSIPRNQRPDLSPRPRTGRLSPWSRTLLGLFAALLLGLPLAGPSRAEDPVPPVEKAPARILEFLPLYKFKATPQDAVHALYETLSTLGITEQQVTITVLGMAPDRLAVQGATDQVEIVKKLLNNIDPPPRPAPAPESVAELIDEVKITYLAPDQLWTEVDRVMFTFLDFKRFDPGLANLVVYAKGDGSESRLTFFIPNPEQVADRFATRNQGYTGYTVYIRATDREKPMIETLKGILKTIDQPLQAKRYEVIELHYTEVNEALKSLRAAGYNAVTTSTGELDAGVLSQIQSGASPVIYSAPDVQQDTAEVSSSLGGGTSGGSGVHSQFKVLTFDNPVASNDIHRLIVYGSLEEIAGVNRYLELIDVPAKQMVIEAQIVEINVDDLSDLGLRSIGGKDDILSGVVNPRFPGEGGSGGGSISSTDAASFFTYDDASQPAGSFQAQIAALVLQGKATIKARPRVVTVDGRQAIISIVRQVPVAQETLSSTTERSTFDINFVPVGITLNLKPRVGENNSEVQMQVNAVVSNVETINNVVSGINLQAPELNTREVSTFVRVPNHRSLVLGGLINTETEERTFKTPILGDLPLIGPLFTRTRKDKDRTEIIIVITPHIVEEEGGRTEAGDNPYQVSDPRVSPKGSPVFDELTSLLSQATYLLKLKDIRGIDPVSRQPLSYEAEDPPLGDVDDPVFLTLAGIVRELDLVNELKLTNSVTLPPDWAGPRTQYESRRVAESFLIGYIIESNRLRIVDLVPGRELLIPAAGASDDLETGFVSEKWQNPQLLAMTKGTLYDRILQSLRALDFTADGKDGWVIKEEQRNH